VALLVLVLRTRWAAAAAGLVAAAGAGILALTTVVSLDGTRFGLPYLFEPSWYPAKTAALLAQLVALAATAAVLLLQPRSPARQV
jgi:hypothetical protein